MKLAWQRSWCNEHAVSGFQEIDVPKLLAQYGMSESVREGQRMCQANQIWYDNELWPDSYALPCGRRWACKDGTVLVDGFSSRRERMVPIGRRLRDDRFWIVEPGDCIGVGKNVDEAMCHTILMVEASEIPERSEPERSEGGSRGRT